MTDYEHSSNFHKIAFKIRETNNLKDLETLKKKLGELEQDDEVRELIAKCDEREEEIKDLIKKEKYKKAVSGFDIEGDDLESQISSFQEINDYKDSAKYLHSLNTEKKYRFLVKSYDSGNCNWEKVLFGFKALGEYKKAHEYCNLCQLRADEQKKEKELKGKRDREEKLKKDYQEAIGYMEKGSFGDASLRFADLGDYQDSKQKAEECKKKQEENELQQKRAKKKHDRIAILILLSAIIIGVGIYLCVGLTHWTVDESGHWHQLLSSRSSYSKHEYVLLQETLPTCEINGRNLFQCSICDYLWEETIKPLGHDPDDGVTTKEPTCTESGERTIHCKTCGVVIRTVTLPKLEHSNVITTLEPSCLSRGLAEYTCSVCGYSETHPINPLGHVWQEKSRTEPTCTKEGLVTYECSRCGKEYTENISATGHNWTQIEIKNANCVNYGTIKSVCSSCNETKIEYIPAKGHNYFDGRCLECGFDRDIFEVGGYGPAGGLIFYDCDADNNSGNWDGLKSSECGWRFLEASMNDLKVIEGVPTINSDEKGYADALSEFVFGYFREDENGVNLFVNGLHYRDENYRTENDIGKGKINTIRLYSAMGDVAYSSDKGPAVTSNYAARLCAILVSSNNGVSFGDWFLPTHEDFRALRSIRQLGHDNEYYWTSVEYADYAVMFTFDPERPNQYSYPDRSRYNKIIPFRSF